MSEKIPQKVKGKIKELERENIDLRKCVHELKEQIQTIKLMYSNEDYEEGEKSKRMEKEIRELREEKEKRKIEIDELKKEKNKKECIMSKEQNQADRVSKSIRNKERAKEETIPRHQFQGPLEL